MTEPETTLSQALALHQQGRLEDAARLYQAVLERQPNHFDALHLLGTAALQSGQPAIGVDLLRRAIEANGTVAAAHVTLGNGLRDLRRLNEALASYDTAIALVSDYGRAWLNRGNVLLDLGFPEQAVRSHDRSIALDPAGAEAFSGRGNALCALKRFDDAIASYDRAIAARPDFADAWHNRGNAFLEMARFEAALDSHDTAIALNPRLAEAHSGRGNALWELKQPEAALAAFDRAIALRPDFADAHCNRSNALRDLRRFEEALRSCDTAIAVRPEHARAHHNRGNALFDLKRPEEALASYDKAIALNPGDARAYFNRGNALLALTRRRGNAAPSDRHWQLANIEHALKDFDKSIALEPDHAPAHCHRGSALVAMLDLDEAAASFRNAVDLQPGYVDAHWNDGLRSLLMGQFETGWRGYEWRKQLAAPVAARAYSAPLWDGRQDIMDKTLFLYWEQGFGDTIQFCRYALLAEARGATVILEAQRFLQRLLRQLSPTIQLITPDKVPPAFDYHCPLMSLPLAFGTTLETIPAAAHYLRAEDAWREKWSARLPGAGKQPRIGVVWSGSATHRHDHMRSLSLEACLPLFNVEAEWICLQKDTVESPAVPLLLLGNELEDFSDTAAVIELLDLVISVDTSVAHLAGAMGKPVWVLLPFSPDWRWLLDRDDSPWYPSMTLFRQPAMGDWDSVIQRVTRALRSRFAEPR